MPQFDFIINFIIPAIAGGGGGWILLRFLGQRFVDHALAKNLEQYREELKGRTEILKSQLSVYAHEQSVATSRADSQRSDAIHKIFRCMRDVINPISAVAVGTPIVNGSSEQNVDFYLQNAETAYEASRVLSRAAADLAIYFDDDTFSKIIQFCKVSLVMAADYLKPLRRAVSSGEQPEIILLLAESGRAKLKQQFDVDLTPSVQSLTLTFRIQLGIERPHKGGSPS